MSAQDYEQLTLFPADSHVSHSVWLVSKKAKGTTVTSGLRCSELSESCARIESPVRTYLESSRLPPGRWSRIWSALAITSSCLIMKLRLSELGTEEACGALCTEAASALENLVELARENEKMEDEAEEHAANLKHKLVCKQTENNILRGELRRMFQLYVAAEMRADTGTEED